MGGPYRNPLTIGASIVERAKFELLKASLRFMFPKKKNFPRGMSFYFLDAHSITFLAMHLGKGKRGTYLDCAAVILFMNS